VSFPHTNCSNPLVISLSRFEFGSILETTRTAETMASS
ncbi:MAG: hypothetical protein ACI9FU_000304, partial [Granulosicoccus sp.]